jgi:predicted porin
MKKSLVALAALAVVSAASAQSSVTLFGVVDATLAVGKGDLTDRTRLTNSGYNSSRIGFRGTEDLGGGMSASFWLEAGVNNDDGTLANSSTNNQLSGIPTSAATGGTGGVVAAGSQGLTFNRRSTVSLAGGFGELRLGRDYTPQFWNLTVFDPFGTNGVGTTQTLNSSLGGPTIVRASNSIGYFLPGNIGGIYGQVQYSLGENPQATPAAATEKDGNGVGIRVGFANGPINVALATSKTKYAAPLGDVKSTNIGASYNFGIATVMAHYAQDKNSLNADGKGYLLGAAFPIGAGEIKAAYSVYKTDAPTTPKSKKLAIGYVHNLSKRTALYTTFARVSNSGGAASALNGATTAVNGDSTGYDFGVRHSF